MRDEPANVGVMIDDLLKHLVQRWGLDAAEAFIRTHFVDGAGVLARMKVSSQRAFGKTLDIEPEDCSPETLDGDASTTLSDDQPTAEVAGRPGTQVDRVRYQELLDRKWMVTGYILRVRAPGRPSIRIPLNYCRVTLGPRGSREDVALDLPEGTRYQGSLVHQSNRFILYHEGGDVPTRVNGQEVAISPIGNGDVIEVGPVSMRAFQLLEPAAELVVLNGDGAGERFTLDISEVLIGRAGRRENDVVLRSPTVSREHARIAQRSGKFWLEPETTSSPTAVNGESLDEPRMLVDNDQLLLGEQILQFRVRGDRARPRTLQARIATVLFSDLRGWTTLAETTPLQQLIRQVDEYYKAMGEIITRYGGTLMTYQGDAIMAVFGAPSRHADDPWRAGASAVLMQQELEMLNARWESEGKSALASGIGIHTGQVMVGELGHSSRLEYSAMGDATNLASRLQQLTRSYGCPIIVSDATFAELGTSAEAEELGEVVVRGRSSPTRIFHLKNVALG